VPSAMAFRLPLLPFGLLFALPTPLKSRCKLQYASVMTVCAEIHRYFLSTLAILTPEDMMTGQECVLLPPRRLSPYCHARSLCRLPRQPRTFDFAKRFYQQRSEARRGILFMLHIQQPLFRLLQKCFHRLHQNRACARATQASWHSTYSDGKATVHF
jgi:hypothetical protein